MFTDKEINERVNIILTMDDDRPSSESRAKGDRYSVHLKGARHEIVEGNRWVPEAGKEDQHSFKGRLRFFESFKLYEYHIHIPPEQVARIDWDTFTLEIFDYDSGVFLSTKNLSYQVAKEIGSADKFKYFFGSSYVTNNALILPTKISLEEAETILSDSGFEVVLPGKGIFDRFMSLIFNYYLSVFPKVENDLQVLAQTNGPMGRTVQFNERYLFVKAVKGQSNYYILFDITNDLLSNIENTIIQKIVPTLLFAGIIFIISIVYILMYSKYVVIARRVPSIEAELEEKENDLISSTSSLETVTQLSAHELRNPLNDLSSSIQLKEGQIESMPLFLDLELVRQLSR